MSELIKIREMSLKYDISSRALKYYEEMGLINSVRSDDYSYRMYDELAVKRLEQILILRKLNISIKDIQRIFNTSSSEVVLEVLEKKVENIDEEVSLLHELKEIVLEFIHQIEQADFSKESDVKMLYKKAKNIETQIVNVEYEGNSAKIKKAININEELKGQEHIEIVFLPTMRVLSSFLKESHIIDDIYASSNVSDFYKWLDKNMMPAIPGSHELLDFQNIFVMDGYEQVSIRKISNEFINDTQFVDYIFGGGMFAALYAYDDEGIGEKHDQLLKYISNSNYYDVDYLPNGNQRAGSFGETIFSPDLTRYRTAIYIPIKKRDEKNKYHFAIDDKYLPNKEDIGRKDADGGNYMDLLEKVKEKHENNIL